MAEFCTYFNQDVCRSCGQLAKPVSDQLKRKETILRDALAAVSTVPYLALPSVSGKLQGFRNKAKMVVTGTVEDPIIGLLGVDKDEKGREILDCPVHHPRLNQVLHELKKFIPLAKIEPYLIATQKGELKGIICFHSEHSDEMYIRFVTRSKESFSRIEKHAKALLAACPFITSISGNVQPIPHAILEGPEEVVLAGKGSVTHRLALRRDPSTGSSKGMETLDLELAPRAFVQTNQEIAEHLYQTAAAWVKEIKTEKFCELFCGQGAFSFFAKDSIKQGLGIELNSDAVVAAKSTAQKLKADHLKFIAADAGSVEAELIAFAPDVILVNPPRKGLGAARDFLKNCTASWLIYSSCSYQSLAQDLAVLPDYEIVKLQIFDMFPHTDHFETLVLLRSKG